MRRLTKWLAGLAGAALVLAACGGGGSSDSSIDVATGGRAEKLIAASADKADAAGTARMHGKITVALRGESPTDIAMDGVMDFRNRAYEFVVDYGKLAGAQGVKMQVRVVDGLSYMRFEGLTGETGRTLGQMMGGKQWLKVDPAQLGMGSSESFGDTNPNSAMDALRGMSDPKVVGTERVRGVETTHYRGTLDLNRALAKLPEGASGPLGRVRDTLEGDWNLDVWVGPDGLSRKVAMDVDTGKMLMAEDLEFSDFGAPVDLSAPPPDQVGDFGDVMKSMTRGLSGLEPAA
jgi:hypothetical protein